MFFIINLIHLNVSKKITSIILKSKHDMWIIAIISYLMFEFAFNAEQLPFITLFPNPLYKFYYLIVTDFVTSFRPYALCFLFENNDSEICGYSEFN